MKLRAPHHLRSRGGDYDLLPLINIVFLLLVFFLLSATLTPADDRRHLPASAQVRAVETSPAVLRVRADGVLEFAGAPLLVTELTAAAAAWRQAHPGQALPVEADAATSATGFLALLPRLRAAGVEQLRLRARPVGG